jgi:ATP-dependent helicase HepA
LPLVQRDRNAAWFAEPDGAQLLICSEIGSEGRNFQFAHHLVLFDLPLNPGLLEQRIGRLDRIGQTTTIQIHAPYLVGSSDELVLEWYHRGLDAIETPLHGGTEYQEKFRDRLLTLALAAGDGKKSHPAWDVLLKETIAFRAQLSEKMRMGRDRLLELNSFNPKVAEQVIARVQAADSDPFWKNFLGELLDHFGVRIKDHEEGDVFYDPSHAFIEAFPSIPAEGMLATFDRRRAIAREDIRFLSADHPLLRDALDLLINSPAGTTAFGQIEADEPNLLLEAVFVLETVADSRWHVDQFLAPTPIRVVVDARGEDLSAERSTKEIADYVEEMDLARFLERPGFNGEMLKGLVEAASEKAEERSGAIREGAQKRAQRVLGEELQRLTDLKKINDHISQAEIELTKEQMKNVLGAIGAARVRLDSLRLIVEGDVDE